MESTDYARLQAFDRELIYKWHEAKLYPSECNPDTAVNRLITERKEIGEQILAFQLR